MPMIRRSLMLALASLTLAGAVQAQDAAAAGAEPALTPVVTPAPEAGPRLESLRAGAVAVAPAPAGQPAPLQRAPSQRSRTLMIIGGAMLLGGAIIDDDAGTIIMLGGLGVGLYGLWLHLQ